MMETILKRIKEWFTAPVFPDDEDKTRNAQVLSALLLGMLFFLLLTTLGTIFIVVKKAAVSIILLALLIWVLISWALGQRGRVLAASRLFVFGAWIIFILSILLTGRINTTFVSLQLAVTVMAGILLGRRSAITLALLSILVGLGLSILENTGYPLVHYFPVPPLTGWVAWVLTFILILTPLNPTIQSVARSAEALREKQHFIESVLASTPDIVHIYDLQEQRNVFLSRSFMGALGYTPEEIQSMGNRYLQQLLHPEDYERLPELFGRWNTVEDGELLTAEYRMKAKSGGWRCFQGRDMVFKRGIDGKVQQFIGTIHDITEHKQMELALQESQERYKLAAAAAKTNVWELNLQTGKVYTDEYSGRLGYSEAEYPKDAEAWQALTHPDDLQSHLETLQAHLEGRTPEFLSEHRALHKDGSSRWVLARGEAQRDEHGKLIKVIGTSIDITERKQTEEALRESEERLELVLEGSQLGYWDWNIETGEVHRDARWAEMLGYTLEEIEFNVKQWTDLHHPDDRELAWKSIQDHLEGRTPAHRVEYRMRTKDGGYKWILDQAKVVKRDSQGKPLRMSGTHTDITDRKEAENNVERGRKLLASTLDALPVGVCLTDETGHYRLMNDAYCAIYEYEREKMLGQHYSVIMSPDQVALANAHYARLLSGDVGIPVERKRQRKGGSIVYIEAANGLVESVDGQKMVITTVRDITERKKAENITQVRLRVNEFAREHPLDELLQNALDELCALTDSPIGFFHFVEPDQRTLSLQAWSTRTLAEFCKAEGKGLHYDIDQAGVWVDCVRQGAPVIHNDYASLPASRRKGLPEGHAPIIREMVFPIMRNQKIVAIIGVGNKTQDYTEDDLVYASRQADILWDIAERKQAEEREREQHALAEALSDTAAALNSTLNFNEVLNRVLDNLGQVVPHDAANIMLLDKDGDTLSIACHRGYLERGAKKDAIERQFSLATISHLTETARNGRPLVIQDTHADPDWIAFPATQWIQSYLTVPIQIRQTTVGFLNLDSETSGFFNLDHAERLRAFANHAAIAIQNAQLYEDMKIIAVTDALTGIYNRAFFETELARMELSRDFPVSIIVADLDNLKTTNDQLGHTAGDRLIKDVAQILRETFRAADIIARIGGDEFAVLLPNTDSATAEQMLSRVRAKLVEHNTKNPHLPVLLSLGASTAEQDDLTKTLAIADQRMYADKTLRKSKDE